MLRQTTKLLNVFIFCISFGYASDGDGFNPITNILLKEYQLYPDATIQDFYKLIHQSAMGPGHWKMDFTMARSYLHSEVMELSTASTQPLCQFISPDSELVRINLSSYIAIKGDIDSLANAFVRTSQEFPQSTTLLEKYLLVFLQAADQKVLPFHTDTVRSYIKRMKQNGYPAVHHSTVYREKYLPAYRVVYRKHLPASMYHATH